MALVLLAALAAVLCYVALSGQPNVDPVNAGDDTPADPSGSPTPVATPDAEVLVPRVPDRRRADFTSGDGLPDGAVVYDSASISSGMQVTSLGLTHGGVREPSTDGIGLIETRLESDVAALGFRVRFPEGESGSVALVAWQSSAVKTLKRDGTVPFAGMRLVAQDGTWALSVYDGQERVLAEGAFEPTTDPVEFRLVREGKKIYVVDPVGEVTTATDLRARRLAGPWASWGLVESSPEQVPAVIESVWAG